MQARAAGVGREGGSVPVPEQGGHSGSGIVSVNGSGNGSGSGDIAV